MKIVSLLLLTIYFVPTEILGGSEDLSTLWTKLRRSNPELRVAEIKVEQAESLLSAHIGGYTPQVGLHKSWTKSLDDWGRSSLDERKNALVVRVDQIILDKELFVNTEAKSVDVKIAKANLESVKSRVLLELILQYYDLLEKESSGAILREPLNGQLSLLEAQAYRVLKAGFRSPHDINQQLLQLNQLRMKLRQLESETRLARSQLSFIVNEPLGTLSPIEKSQEMLIVKHGESKVVPQDMLEVLELKKKDLVISQASAKHWPKVSAFGDWNVSSSAREVEEISSDGRSSASRGEIGLAISVRIWSGLSDFHERKVAQSDKDSSMLHIQAMQKRRHELVQEGTQTMHAEYARFKEAERLWGLAKDLQDMARKQKEGGVASFDALLGPELQVIEMALVKNQSLYSYFKSKAIELSRRGLLESEINNL